VQDCKQSPVKVGGIVGKLGLALSDRNKPGLPLTTFIRETRFGDAVPATARQAAAPQRAARSFGRIWRGGRFFFPIPGRPPVVVACSLIFAFALLAGCAAPSGGKGRPGDRAAAGSAQSGVVAEDAGVAPPSRTSDDEEIAAADEGASRGAVRPKSGRIYPGTGVFVSRRKPVTTAERTEDGGVNLNFVNAHIADVVKTVLGSILRQNYIIDEKVRGRVTMQTVRPIPQDAVAAVLETALRQNGATMIRQAEHYKIVPLTGVQRGNPDLRIDGEGALVEPGHAITIAPLSYVAAAEMKKILQPIAPEGGILHVDTKRNLLLLSGDGHEMAAMQKVISAFDVDWMSGTSFGLFPLEYVDAQTAFSELKSILLGDQDKDVAESLRIVPLARLNAVLAISPVRRNIDHVRDWVARLDVPGDTIEQKIFLYPVQHGSAADLAAILNKFFKGEGERVDSRRLISPGSEPVRIRTPAKSNEQIQAGSPAKTPPPADGTSTQGSAQGPVTKDAGVSTSAKAAAPVHIVEDESRNALLVSATTRDYRNIRKLLRKLDVPPLQVLIEATIAEVKLRDDLRYGLQWFFTKGNNEFTLSEIGSGAIAPTFPGFSYLFSGSNARIAFDTLTSLTDVQIVSSPQLMVMNNTSARLQVGDQVPVPVQSSVGVGSGDAPIVNTIQFRDTGVILQVKPRVNENGMVTLEIRQEVSDAAPTTSSGIDAPTIQQRQLSSIVTVANGHTLALGGIIRTTNSVTKSGLPFLSDIPILGALFGSTGTQEDRTELLILLTPRVVRDSRDGVEITEELRRRFSRLEPLLRDHARKAKQNDRTEQKPAAEHGSRKSSLKESRISKGQDDRVSATAAIAAGKPGSSQASGSSGTMVAPTAEVKPVRAARSSAQATNARSLGVRVGQHKTFTRLVFDWPEVVPYSLTETDRSVSVTFARNARIDLPRLRRRLKGGLANPKASDADGRLKFEIEKPAGRKVRHFLVGPKVVLDFKASGPANRQIAASPRRRSGKALATASRAPAKPAFDLPVIRVKSAPVQSIPSPAPQREPRVSIPISDTDDYWSHIPIEQQIYGRE